MPELLIAVVSFVARARVRGARGLKLFQLMGLVALQHVVSFQTRDQTGVP